ncbi:Sorting nexin mvp1 [Pleosporales sp. CAS-2024a]
MSLFGDEDVPARAQPLSSLFDDEAKPPARAGNSLFADDMDGTASPWALPTPKKAGRAALVKSLLPTALVPAAYGHAFDAVLDAGDGAGSGVSVAGVKKLLARSGVDRDAQARILGIVAPSGQDDAVLGRNEFNVLFALLGLAQEGEDVTLDGVDERKRDLPVASVSLPPSLTPPALDPPRPAAHHQPSPSPSPSPSPPPSPSEPPLSTPARSRPPMRKQSFGDPEADPWGSPDMHKGHHHAPYAAGPAQPNGADAPSAARTTASQFTTHAASASNSTSHQANVPPGSLGSEAGWGGYNGASSQPFATPELGGDGGFAAAPVGGRVRPPPELARSIHRAGGSASASEEVITITAIAEKEGVFLFQHRNYELASSKRTTRVVRRYSDFVWLLDCLHKRYPFRQLPLLPPKRVGINGNPIAADASFLEKRRKGLTRFTNALVRHPVLNQEQLVVMFLTVPTELSVWRKQANLSVHEEFVGKMLPPDLEDSLPKTLPDLFDTVRSGVRQSAESYINLCNMMERMTRRNEGMAAEFQRFSSALRSLTEASHDTYAVDTNDVPLLNEGLHSTARHLDQSRQLLEDEARGWEAGVLEDLKMQRDSLVSVRDMFDRRDKYARDNIPALERRIASNETKLQNVRNKSPDQIKPGEAEKVEDAIFKDKESIVQQHARGVFIKECIRDELLYFQKSQYHISKLHQDWSQERVKYAELQADNWRALCEEVESMPYID